MRQILTSIGSINCTVMYKGIDSMSHCKDLMLQWGTGTGSTKTSIAAIAIAILIVSVVIHDVVIVISSTFGSFNDDDTHSRVVSVNDTLAIQ